MQVRNGVDHAAVRDAGTRHKSKTASRLVARRIKTRSKVLKAVLPLVRKRPRESYSLSEKSGLAMYYVEDKYGLGARHGFFLEGPRAGKPDGKRAVRAERGSDAVQAVREISTSLPLQSSICPYPASHGPAQAAIPGRCRGSPARRTAC
jgi:hypothetical protein